MGRQEWCSSGPQPTPLLRTAGSLHSASLICFQPPVQPQPAWMLRCRPRCMPSCEGFCTCCGLLSKQASGQAPHVCPERLPRYQPWRLSHHRARLTEDAAPAQISFCGNLMPRSQSLAHQRPVGLNRNAFCFDLSSCLVHGKALPVDFATAAAEVLPDVDHLRYMACGCPLICTQGHMAWERLFSSSSVRLDYRNVVNTLQSDSAERPLTRLGLRPLLYLLDRSSLFFCIQSIWSCRRSS